VPAKTHGLSYKHPLWGTWKSMRTRCNNPRAINYHNYGGKGIIVCSRWDSFENFIEDMGDKPTPQHSLERIDGKGNYEPSNCRWATRSEQNSNVQKRTKSGFKGVYWYPRIQRWIARSDKWNGKKHLGSFKTKEEAVKVVTVANRLKCY
jgi:hypothetical protein